jgi:hypothetical protein
MGVEMTKTALKYAAFAGGLAIASTGADAAQLSYSEATDTCINVVQSYIEPHFLAYIQNDGMTVRYLASQRAVFYFDACMDRLGYNMVDK